MIGGTQCATYGLIRVLMLSTDAHSKKGKRMSELRTEQSRTFTISGKTFTVRYFPETNTDECPWFSINCDGTRLTVETYTSWNKAYSAYQGACIALEQASQVLR